MIIVDMNENKVQIEGTANVVLSEITAAIYEVAQLVSQATDRDPRLVMEDILEATKVVDLMKTGMTQEEAQDILNPPIPQPETESKVE